LTFFINDETDSAEAEQAGAQEGERDRLGDGGVGGHFERDGRRGAPVGGLVEGDVERLAVPMLSVSVTDPL
jgi:hypothetical protein